MSEPTAVPLLVGEQVPAYARVLQAATLREAEDIAVRTARRLGSSGSEAAQRDASVAARLGAQYGRLATELEKDTGTTGGESTPPTAERIFYRAGYQGELIPLGHTLNLEAAQARCEEQISREYPAERTLTYDWLHDDGDDGDDLEPYELTVSVDGGPEELTGYIVTPLLATDAPDPDAES